MAKEIKGPDPDGIYKYLGFDVHPGKIEEFWKSEEEKKLYLQDVKARGGQLFVLDRDSALLNVKLMRPADKIISLIGSILLIVSFFLPLYSFDYFGKTVSGNAISFFLNLPFIGGYASWSGIVMGITMLLVALFVLACPVAGVINILGLYNKNKGDQYFETVKKNGKIIFIPIFIFVALFVVLVVGAAQPFGSLGLNALGEDLGVGAIFQLTGFGFWLLIAGLIIGFAQNRGL